MLKHLAGTMLKHSWSPGLSGVRVAIDETILRVLPEQFPDLFPPRKIGEKHYLYDESNPGQMLPGIVSCTICVFTLSGSDPVLELRYGIGFVFNPTNDRESDMAQALACDEENNRAANLDGARVLSELQMQEPKTDEVCLLEDGAVLLQGKYLLVMKSGFMAKDLVEAALLHICLRLLLPHDPYRAEDRAKEDEYLSIVERVGELVGWGLNPKRPNRNEYLGPLTILGK